MEGTYPAGPTASCQGPSLSLSSQPAAASLGHWLWECVLLVRDNPEGVHLSGWGEASSSMKGSLKPSAATFLAA